MSLFVLLGEVNPNLRTLRAKSGYTEQNVFEMMELLREKNWEGPVTFAGKFSNLGYYSN